MSRRLAVSEKAFQQQVIDLAHLYGYLVYHTHDSRRSAPGFPDLTFAHPTRGDFFLAELKSERGRVTPHQEQWIAALQRAGIQCYIWRPSMWDDIVARLTGKAA